ncbi:MAG TPA: heme o synthase, partial [Actinomycetota bacterium]|nr:heme o synthase [Actinomycetota bacterium]
RRLTTATAAATLALVTIGGVVRATGSGLGCPDWPKCHGRWIPPLELESLIEYSHRLTAAVVGVLVMVTAYVAWRRARGDRAVLWPAAAAVPVVIVQAGLGRAAVVGELRVMAVAIAHFLTAMLLVALAVAAAAAARTPRSPNRPAPPSVRPFRGVLRWALVVTALALLAGVYVRTSGASLAFVDWPLMGGRLIPSVSDAPEAWHVVHRLLAATAVILAAVLAARARRHPDRRVRVLAWTAFGLHGAQALIGGAAVLTRLAPATVAGHLAGGTFAWAALIALSVTLLRVTPSGAGPSAAEHRTKRPETVAAYVQLMKPDIIVLLLITTLPAMVLAQGGIPSPWLMAATLIGGTLAAGGANAVNCYLDRDIDEVMARTRHRPLPARVIDPGRALEFGVTLIAAAFAWLALTVNVLAASLALTAAAFYVFVYTAWMKRSTPQNIVIGGAAGGVPALVGWAAVSGTVAAPAWVLFAIVFSWTPPHFWALALRHEGDYRAARIPMLPAVRGAQRTAANIFLYSLLVVAVSLLLVPVAGLGPLYGSTAIVLGAVLLYHAGRLLAGTESARAMALFRYSITYLAVLFATAAVDRLVGA